MILFLNSCSKKSELEDLTLSNNMDPSNNVDIFVLDSVQTSQNPYIKLFYHIKYDLIKDTSKISKIVVYKGNTQVFDLPKAAFNAFSPTDLSVTRFNTYHYSFALRDKNGNLSKFSKVHSVYLP